MNDNQRWGRTMRATAHRAVSFVLLLKAVVGCSVATLALFGVTVPHFGIEPSFLKEGVAATIGAGIGAFLVLRG